MNEAEFSEFTRVRGLRPVGRSYIDRSLREIAKLWDGAIFGVRSEAANVRLHVLLAAGLLVVTSLMRTFPGLLGCAGVVSALVFGSVLRRRFFLKSFLCGGFLVAFFFAVLMAAPATLNLFSHPNGRIIYPLWTLSGEIRFGPFSVPPVVGVTREGVLSAAMLVLRVLISVSVALWLTLSVKWMDLLGALRNFGVPAIVLQIGAMTMVFLHLLLKRSEEVHFARKSRMICRESVVQGHKWTGARIACAWDESIRLMEEVHQAMTARGFRGEANFGKR